MGTKIKLNYVGRKVIMEGFLVICTSVITFEIFCGFPQLSFDIFLEFMKFGKTSCNIPKIVIKIVIL